ncbi:DUF4282 domain-containing protein [Actinomadura sp. 7K534]|uniref:DUF4282 domain-containing protein n=1 Tax=Actinomadura sp. 7K534 TaxID=2530366 RepID=UPI001FB74BDB|nr:DUF4282 domain-containing protein [Actinomadura sp. 7K534]
MTNPSDPGHPQHPPAPGPPGGPYGPPPQQHPQFPQPGAVPGPRPPDPAYGPQDQQQDWTPPPRDPAGKGILGALFDMNFDHMITVRLVKLIYVISLVPITLLALLMAGYGLDWLAQDATFFGLLLLVTAPFMWLFQMLAVRVLMEFVINQFKISEYLRVIKDKD